MTPLVALEEVCSLVTDGTHYTPRDIGTGIPFLTVKDVTEDCLDFVRCSHITEEDYRIAKAGRSAPQKGDVLFSKDGTVGKVHVVNTSASFAVLSSLAILRPNAEKIESRYLGHALRAPTIVADALKRRTGSALRRIILSDLQKLKIPIPALSTQRRIANFLDRADALRAKRRAALAHLDILTHAVFLEIFGDPQTNPKGWPVCQLGDLIASGPQNGLYKPSTEYGAGTPIVRIDAFYEGKMTGVDSLKRVRISPDEHQSYSLRAGDILINRVNSREYLGKSAIVPALPEETVFESNMMRFAVDLASLMPEFLIEYLQTSHVRRHILKCAKDAINQSSINQQDVRSIAVFVPTLEKQREFVRRAAAVARILRAHRHAMEGLDALFASLQHRAFNDEL